MESDNRNEDGCISGDKRTILLIDDDPDMLEIGRRIVVRANYNYLQATSGIEGLEVLVEHKPDLIFLDYMMPDLNGYEFMARVKNEPQFESVRDTPIIMLSARADDFPERQELFDLGLKAFLVKPFGHRELMNVAENVIRISRQQPSARGSHLADDDPSILDGIRASAVLIVERAKAALQDVKGERVMNDLRVIAEEGQNVLSRIDAASS